MDRLTVRVDEDVKEQLSSIAARKGVQTTALARAYIEQGVLADKERLYAPLVRRAVREELDTFLQTSMVRREYAADDFFDRLSADLETDLDDLRALAGATLFLAATLAEGAGASFEGEPLTRDEWRDVASTAGFAFGLGMPADPPIGPAEDAAGLAPEDEEEDPGVFVG